MTLSRRTFVANATVLAIIGKLAELDLALRACAQSASSPHAPVVPIQGTPIQLTPTTLHGFGTLTAQFHSLDGGRSSVTHITCESAQKALLTQAKYLSDLERLGGMQAAGRQDISVVKGTYRHHGVSIPVHTTPTGGVVACYGRGQHVIIIAAADKARLAALFTIFDAVPIKSADFTARVPIPMFLDRWDRYGLLCYFAPEVMPPGSAYLDQTYDYTEGLKFAQQHALGLVLWDNPLIDDNAEGLTNEQAWSWVQENARKMAVPVHINTQISLPQGWLSNRYREQTMLKAPQFMGGYYGVGHDSSGLGAVSWLSQEAEDTLLGIFQHTVRRFAGDPNIVGWLEPHGETSETPQKYFLDSGPYAEEVLRGFLRKRYGTLQALSLCWHGNAAHYQSWSEVRLPEVADFVGFGPEAIDLQTTWRVRYVPAPDGHFYTRDEARSLPSPPPIASVPPAWYQEGFDDSEWDELTAPGNDRMLFLPRSPLVYRRALTLPAEWLSAKSPITLILWDMVNRDSDTALVYVNGQKLTGQSHRVNEQHWSQFDVTGALRVGANLLVLQMPRAILCYRAYLTRALVPQYPSLGPHKNAQWADFVTWNIESRGAQIRRGAEMIRQVDAECSINFMAADDYSDPVKKACQDYGGRFHDTGAMAGFWTDWNTLMMQGVGLPVTAEPGNGAPNAREFQLFWGRWLTEGLNGVHYFQNWGEIAWNPEVLKVFEANQRMYQAIGKYHAPFARVAVLFSLQNDWLTGFPWTPEPDSQGGYYSSYNAANRLMHYCPRDGIGTPDFGTPTVNRFQVILDSNSSFLEDTVIDGIENYVRQGGVFITNGQTGRHTPVLPDSWPISRLTGYQVVGMQSRDENKSAVPAPGQTVFESGSVPPEIHCAGLRLKKMAADCQDLLVWKEEGTKENGTKEDGTNKNGTNKNGTKEGGTAVGMRRLGKGWIVHFGPMLSGDDYVALTTTLLRHFGMMDRVPAIVKPQRGLHFRHFIGNTGLHDVWILFNESDSPLTTDPQFLPGVHPLALTDLVTGQQAALLRDPAGDRVSEIALQKWQTRMFVSPRNSVAASPLEWLTLQRGWWQGTVKPPVKHLPTPKEMQRNTLDLTEDWACRSVPELSDDQVAALARPDLDDTVWERRTLGLWLTPGDKNAKRLLLRRKFTVPAHWTDGQIVLCADVPYAQFFHETRLFLDGNAWAGGRKMVDGPYYDTLDGALKAGTTHVLTLAIESKSTLIGSRGPIWLTYLPHPQQRQDLSGAWTAYADPLRKTGEVQLPGTIKGRYLSRSVVIDAAHKHQSVVIYFEATGDHFSLQINGRLLNTSEQGRARAFTFNVTPLIRFGDPNLIEIVGNSGAEPKTIHAVEIRYYAQPL